MFKDLVLIGAQGGVLDRTFGVFGLFDQVLRQVDIVCLVDGLAEAQIVVGTG